MNKIFKAILIIAFITLSGAFFLELYNGIGFAFSVRCLVGWGLSLATFAVVANLFYLVMDDEF